MIFQNTEYFDRRSQVQGSPFRVIFLSLTLRAACETLLPALKKIWYFTNDFFYNILIKYYYPMVLLLTTWRNLGMFNFHKIAENRIKEAMEQGEFDDIKGRGKPLVFEDNTFIPPELQSEKEIKAATDLLESLEDEQERYRQVQKVNFMVTKVNMSRKRPINLERNQIYYRKVVERTTVRKK
jgi:hypothetical protein